MSSLQSLPLWEPERLPPPPTPVRSRLSCAPTRPIGRPPGLGHVDSRLLLHTPCPLPPMLAKPAPKKRVSSAQRSSHVLLSRGSSAARGLSGVSAEWLSSGPRLVGVLGGSSEKSPQNPTPPPLPPTPTPVPFANRSHALSPQGPRPAPPPRTTWGTRDVATQPRAGAGWPRRFKAGRTGPMGFPGSGVPAALTLRPLPTDSQGQAVCWAQPATWWCD